MLDLVSDFLEKAHKNDERYTIREGIHIANYAGKLIDYEKTQGRVMDPTQAVLMSVERILGVKQTRYIKQIIWDREGEG